MSALIDNKKDFQNCTRVLKRMIDRRVSILNNPLKGKPAPDFWFWADNSRTSYFEQCIQSLLRNNYEDVACVYMLNPHPVNYFHNNFGLYPAGLIKEAQRTGCYLEIIEEEPIESVADSIEIIGRYFVVFSMKGSWIFLISRELDIGYFYSKDTSYKNIISKCESFVEIKEFYEMYKEEDIYLPYLIKKLGAFLNQV